MEVVVVSFGGVGTSLLMSFLEQYRVTNSPVDRDGLKHSALPPISFNRRCRFIYLHGSPQLAAVSFFRRNLHYFHSGKLQEQGRGFRSPIPKEMTLAEYAAQGVDRFLFRRHFFNWYRDYLATRPTMFMRYETLFDQLQPLQDFLELTRAQIETFPKKQARNSRLEDIGADTRAHLDAMYGDFAAELARLPDVEVRQRAGGWFRAGRYLRPAYLKAYLNHGAFAMKVLMETHAPKTYALLRRDKSNEA